MCCLLFLSSSGLSVGPECHHIKFAVSTGSVESCHSQIRSSDREKNIHLTHTGHKGDGSVSSSGMSWF